MLELVPDNYIQNSILDRQDRGKFDLLMLALDKVNSDFGVGALRYAAEGLDKRWRMKQNYKSGRYTTCWDDIISVSAESGDYGIQV